MAHLPYVLLSGGWSCDYFELNPTLYEFMETHAIPLLQSWTFDKRMNENWAAWIWRTFDLPPMDDICLNYVLSISQTPDRVELHLNGRNLGMISAPLEIDVTDMVTLDENRIAFRVPCDAEGQFGDIRLRAVPCR